MNRSYALKVETKSFKPHFHAGYKTREDAEIEMGQLVLLEGWSCTVVYVERRTETALAGLKEKYIYVELNPTSS